MIVDTALLNRCLIYFTYMATQINAQHESRGSRQENWVTSSDLEEAIRELRSIAQQKYFPAGATIFAAGELPAGLFLLHSGEVRLFLPPGRQNNFVALTILPGGLLGLSEAVSGRPHEMTATAESPSEVALFPRTTFMKIIFQNPQFCLSLSAFISTQVEDAYERICMIRSDKPGARAWKSSQAARLSGTRS